MDENERKELAARVTAARLGSGLGKEAIARKARVSSITWKRVEDGLGVREDRLAAILRAVDSLTTPTAPAGIAVYDDDELLAEIRRRMTRRSSESDAQHAAASTQAGGSPVEHVTDEEAEDLAPGPAAADPLLGRRRPRRHPV